MLSDCDSWECASDAPKSVRRQPAATVPMARLVPCGMMTMVEGIVSLVD